MRKQTLIDGLNHDLAGEYQAILQYLQHYFVMKGPERLTVGELFKKIAIGEMKHAEFLAEKIVALGDVPTVTPLPIVQPATVRAMLKANLAAERQAVIDYAERAEQAEEFEKLLTGYVTPAYPTAVKTPAQRKAAARRKRK